MLSPGDAGGSLMATATPPADGTGGAAGGGGALEGEKGLKTGAIGFVSSVVIGVASTAPGYSLAASLGLVVAVGGIGLHAPAIMLVAFVPMLFIAAAYYYLNRADPDCGTTFAWVTRAMGRGPAGWAAGRSSSPTSSSWPTSRRSPACTRFLLFGWQSAADSTAGGHARRRRRGSRS